MWIVGCIYWSVIISVNFPLCFRPRLPALPIWGTIYKSCSQWKPLQIRSWVTMDPYNGKEFNAFLTGLGIRHTTSSPNYPQSNGFIERQIQMVKRLMEKATSTGRSFQEAPISLRAMPLGDGLPSPAKILHGRSIVTRKTTPVDLVAVCQALIALTRPDKQRPSDHWWLVRKFIFFKWRMNGK